MRGIVQAQGVAGLYRGVGVSLATFVPSSALWWGAYGAYQRLLDAALPAAAEPAAARALADAREGEAAAAVAAAAGGGGGGWEMTAGQRGAAVQVGAGLCAGLTSGLLTTPLDVLKTRLQTQTVEPGQAPLTLRQVAAKLLREQGPRGLLRGAVPRMANVALWGTAMVSAYEQAGSTLTPCKSPSPPPVSASATALASTPTAACASRLPP